MFSNIQLRRWRQFREVDIEFHERLTILTGANGAGKTTILNMLNRHFGWNLLFISTPRRERKELVEYFSDYWSGTLKDEEEVMHDNHVQVGEIRYSDDSTAQLLVPDQVQQEYEINVAGQQPVQGLFVSSHRPVFFYQQVGVIPTQPIAREQLLDQYLSEIRARYRSGGHIHSPSYRLKEALISLAVFGYGNQVVAQNLDYQRTFDGFQKVLRQVLPPSLGFRRLEIEMPEVILRTDSGSFSLDAVSGGVSAILDLSWQIYMYSLEHAEFCVVIDEPENHLHPELQQALLSNLLAAFPTAQLVIATHNPFMISSVPYSNVYVLRYDKENRVYSELLDLVNKAGTANEILRDVLGLDFTMPIWASNQLDQIITAFSGRELNDAAVAELRQQLAEIGLEDSLPQTLSNIVDNRADD